MHQRRAPKRSYRLVLLFAAVFAVAIFALWNTPSAYSTGENGIKRRPATDDTLAPVESIHWLSPKPEVKPVTLEQPATEKVATEKPLTDPPSGTAEDEPPATSPEPTAKVLDSFWHKGVIDVAAPDHFFGWYCHRTIQSKDLQFLLTIKSRFEDEVVYEKTFQLTVKRADVLKAESELCGEMGMEGFSVVPPVGTRAHSTFTITVIHLSGQLAIFQFPSYEPTNGVIMGAVSAFKVDYVEHRRALPVVVDNNEPVRMNVLVPGIGYDLTGGPLSILHFCVLAAKAGIKVRWINIDGHGVEYEKFTQHLKKYKGLGDFDSLVEFVHDGHSFRKSPPAEIKCNEKDQFVATVYFTAYYAWHTVKKLGYRSNIIYFIQDFEPIFFAHDSPWLEAYETYTIPHFPIFSTPFLQDYFKANQLGVYANCKGRDCEDWTYASEPSVKRHAPLNIADFPANRKRKLVCYARPHAPRNAFDATVSVISQAIKEGVFGDHRGWEFIGSGSVYGDDICGLGGFQDACLTMIRNIPEPKYLKMLGTCDIGFSLMVSPHPSLPPFDFAAAGLVTLTNSFDTKTPDSFVNVSKNVIVRPPFLADLVDGMREAVARIDDLHSRKRNSRLNWAASWDDDRCYGPTLMSKIKQWELIKGTPQKKKPE